RRAAVEGAGDMVEAVEGHAQREGEAGADLEDGEADADEGGEGLRGLVVGGMGLEDEAGQAVEDGGEGAGLLRRVGDDAVVAELDAGLDDGGDGAGEGGLEAEGGEGPAVDLDGRERSLGGGDGEVVEGLE